MYLYVVLLELELLDILITHLDFFGNAMNNGIWLRHDYCGSIGTANPSASKTFVHEVGHWLNLPHTWGSTNEPGLASNCTTDDGVTDTPNTIGSQWCNYNETTCGSGCQY